MKMEEVNLSTENQSAKKVWMEPIFMTIAKDVIASGVTIAPKEGLTYAPAS